MKNQLKTFQIYTNTEFGIGCFKKKALSFFDAFQRLCYNDKRRVTSIQDEDGEEISSDEILQTISFDHSLA